MNSMNLAYDEDLKKLAINMITSGATLFEEDGTILSVTGSKDYQDLLAKGKGPVHFFDFKNGAGKKFRVGIFMA